MYIKIFTELNKQFEKQGASFRKLEIDKVYYFVPNNMPQHVINSFKSQFRDIDINCNTKQVTWLKWRG